MPEVRRRRSRGLRRWRRRLRKYREAHPRAVWAAAAGGAVVLGALWCTWTAVGAARDLGEVEDQAKIMRAALVRGDVEGARDALADFQEATEAAADRTGGLTWSMFEVVPFLGDDAEGVAAAAEVLRDLGRDGLPPVVDAAEHVTASTFQPENHTFPLERIAALEPLAVSSEESFDRAHERLLAVDSSGFLGAIETRYDVLEALVEDARNTLQSTYRAARLMPVLLGQDKPQNFLLVLQNNAESRSSGGLPGSVSLVEASRGRVDIVEQIDMAALGVSPQPILPLTDEEETVFGRILGTIGVNATLTPDFPRAADLIRARWEQVQGGEVDGVLFVDPVAVSYLLQTTGEIPVPGYDTVSAANVVAKVENEIYAGTQTTEQQSEYQNAVAKAVFDVFSDGYGNTADVIRALAVGVHEGRIRMHFFDEEPQAEVAGTAIAGEFVGRDGPAPEVGIYLNDGGPTKMQFYLKRDASLVARSCIDGRQVVAGTLTLENATPPRADQLPDTITGEFFPGNRTDPGQQILVIYLTTPVGGDLEELAVDGQKVTSPVVQEYAGHKVVTVGLVMDPGDRQEVTFTMKGGPGQEGDPRLHLSPGAQPGSPNGSVRNACRIR